MMHAFELWFHGIGESAIEVLMGLLPIVIIFFVLRFAGMRVRPRAFKKIMAGFAITYFGLVFFMQGVHIAFMPVGTYLGGELATKPYAWILIPIGFIIGFLVAFAEPAVHVMTKQVEELSSGTIKSSMLLAAISIGVATAVMGAMIRMLVGFSLWWYLVPGYIIVFALAKFVEPTFMAIAFDNGGVATGPMCSTFILAFSVAVAGSTPGRDPLMDGFGIVALIAMAPIITTMILSFIVQRREKRRDTGDEPQLAAEGPSLTDAVPESDGEAATEATHGVEVVMDESTRLPEASDFVEKTLATSHQDSDNKDEDNEAMEPQDAPPESV